MQELKQSESELTQFALSNGDVEYKRINRHKKAGPPRRVALLACKIINQFILSPQVRERYNRVPGADRYPIGQVTDNQIHGTACNFLHSF